MHQVLLPYEIPDSSSWAGIDFPYLVTLTLTLTLVTSYAISNFICVHATYSASFVEIGQPIRKLLNKKNKVWRCPPAHPLDYIRQFNN